MQFQREQQAFELERLRLQQANREISSVSGSTAPKMPKYVEGEDIEVFIATFEKLATANGWDKTIWAPRFGAVLTGKAQEAYSRLSLEDSKDYEKIKSAILRKYELSAEAYRRKFRFCKRKSDETFREWSNRLTLLYDRWMEGEKAKTVDDVRKVLIVEQLLEMTTKELQVWLRERTYDSVSEMADDADMYAMAHWKKWGNEDSKKGQEHKVGKQFTNSNPGKSEKDKKTLPISKIQCYNCKAFGHYSSSCKKPKRSTPSGSMSTCICNRSRSTDGLEKYKIYGKLNGKDVTMLRDTGASTTYVHPDFVSKADYTGESTVAGFANGTEQNVPSALVDLIIEGKPYERMKVGVMNTPFPVLLGNEWDEIEELALIVTRSKARALLNEEAKADLDMKRTGVVSSPITESDSLSKDIVKDNSDVTDENEVDIDNKVTESDKSKSDVDNNLSKELKVTGHKEGKVETDTGISDTFSLGTDINPFDLDPGELEKLQIQDSTLDKARQKGSCPENNAFYRKSGILYRTWKNPHDSELPEVHQVVVPNSLRRHVLKLAHAIPLAGHLGVAKT